ncbi:MAG: hypothetical protein KatS3mg009_1982 [Acidimicrobiia bacterium]|nr:MAG: hypothetical protein KatS3mg009_1982 [Acidimicrobiia bacterium]
METELAIPGFVNAALLVFVVLAVTDFVKAALPGDLDPRFTPLLALLVAVGAVFAVAESDWGGAQMVGDVSLAAMNVWSKLIVAVLLVGGAATADKVLNAVRNVGENQGSRPPTE